MFLFYQSKIKYDATHYDMCSKNANKKNRKFAFITGSAILLATTVAISFMITEDAFARNGRYGAGDTTSQAAAVSNDCLNPILDSNTIDNMVGVGNCGSTVSQQDESGQASAPITHQTANPTIEVQRATTTTQPPLIGTGGNCTACFDPLTDAQKSEYESILQDRSVTIFGRELTTIEELCTLLRNIVLQGRDPIEAIEAATNLFEDVQGVSSGTVSDIMTCLLRAVE
jgi:hypothetical protein